MGLLATVAPTKAGVLNKTAPATPSPILPPTSNVFGPTSGSTPVTKGALPYDPYSQSSIDQYQSEQRLSKGTDLPDAGTMLKSTGQGLLRSSAAAGAAIAALPTFINANAKALKDNKPVEVPEHTGEFVLPPEGDSLGSFERALFGVDSKKIQNGDTIPTGPDTISLQSVGEEFPLVKKGSKIAPVVGAVGSLLDLTGAGEEAKGLKGLTVALKATTDATEATNILRRAGFAADIAEHAGPKFATLTDAKDVENGLMKLQDLQNTTTKAAKAGTEVSANLFPTAQHAAEAVDKALPSAERGFAESVKETMPELKTRVGGQYIVRDTDTLAMQAKNFIKDDPDAAFHAATTGTDEKAVATASELIKKYTADAMTATDKGLQNHLYDKAAEVANKAAANLTELGRAVQAASILGRLTPEGLVRFAARTIQKYNEAIDIAKDGGMGTIKPSAYRSKIPELTGEQTKTILDRAKQILAMPDGDAKAIAFKELTNHISSLTPTPLFTKLVTIWKAGLLTGLKTTGLNEFSNLFHGVSEGVKDIPAAAFDSVASLFTGKRTLALTGKGTASGVKEGFQKGWRYFKTGYDERDVAGKLDFTKVNFGNSIVAKAIQKYEETIFHTLGAEDQPFYYGAKARSMYSQAIAIGKNEGLKGAALSKRATELVEKPSDEMLKYAVYDAETAVFQNKTGLSQAASAVKRAVPLSEIILPFSKTPSAAAMQILNYSPVGVVKEIAGQIIHRKFDQRLLSQAVGRSVIGTAASYLGKKLYDKGIISLSAPTTESEQKQWELEGRTANSINIGGKWRSLTVLGPAGNELLAGAWFAQGLKDTGSVTSGLIQAATGAAKSLTDQTFLKGVNQFTNAINNPQGYSKALFQGLIGSLVPTLVSDTARATDTKERRTPGLVDTAKSRVPGVRETLEPQVNTFGEEKKTPNFLTVMADPTRPIEGGADPNDPVTLELRRLLDAGYKATPTQVGTKNGYAGLTGKQNTQLWERGGEIVYNKLTSLVKLPEYQQADDEKKAKLVGQIADKSQTVARAEMVLQLTHGLTGDALRNELSKLKTSKLMSVEVFNQYLNIR